MAHLVKNLPAMQETPVQFLGWEDPLEKGMATHSNILTWRIPWTEEPDVLESMERMLGQDSREAVAGLRGFHLPEMEASMLLTIEPT